MNTQFKVVAAFVGCCCWGFACSQTNGTSAQNGGTGGNDRTGGSTSNAATGGNGAGGTTSGGGSGGSSVSGQGGSSVGGAAGSASGGAGTGGSGVGGTGTGGGGGSKTSGTGGTSLGGSGGAGTAGTGSGGKGTGGVGNGGIGGTVTGGTTGGGGSGSGGNNTGGAGSGGTAGGTGAGGAATGGATGTGGSTSSPVVPTTVSSTGRDSFAFGDVIFEVDPKVGARVATLSLGGANMIATIAATDTDNTTWGGVFWTSPQKAWDSNWPPPAALDSNAYKGGISGNHLVLDSDPYTALGVSVSKDFSADSATGWITIVYTIKATKAVQAAPWENCRVPRGGLAFFPAGSSLAKGPLTMTESASIDWFDDKSMSVTGTNGAKAIADGSGGWAAYALGQNGGNGGNLFLRKFTNTPASAQAPGEGQDEIYPGPTGSSGFLELEVQGPYTSIPAGGSLAWTIAWRIVKIPTSVTVSAGSTTLADFAKQQAAL